MSKDILKISNEYIGKIDSCYLTESANAFITNSDIQEYYKQSKEQCLKMIRDNYEAVVNLHKPIQTRGGFIPEFYASVPDIRQINNWCCGATSVTQALGAKRILPFTPFMSQSDSEPLQQEIIDYMGITSNNSPAPYQLENALDHYIGSDTYTCIYIGNSTPISDISDMIWISLMYDYPPILNSNTEFLGYYNNDPYDHYITVSKINISDYSVEVTDCNLNSPYGGVHETDLYEIKNAIKGKFLICKK